MKRKIALLLVSLLSLMGMLTVSNPVEASQKSEVTQAAIGYPYGCSTSDVGHFCLYSGYFVGKWDSWPQSQPRNVCHTADGGHITQPGTGEQISLYTFSVVNTSQVENRWFRDSHCAGASIYIFGHTSVILPTGWTGLTHASWLRTSTVG